MEEISNFIKTIMEKDLEEGKKEGEFNTVYSYNSLVLKQ